MAPSVMDRSAQMFPTLTAPQVERIGRVGRRRDVRAGEVLFDVGDQNTCFFVVLSGEIAIVLTHAERERVLVVHRAGQFTGEINMLSARRSLTRARAVGDGTVLALDRDELRDLVRRDAELSELLMRAFILRRVALMAEGTDELVLLGSRHSGSTQQIREFLSRNGQPFTYQDVETDPSVQTMLDRFHVRIDEVPVVICRGGHVFRNPSIDALAGKLGLAPDLRAEDVRDVVIVGGGPAGLAAAVYASSEGLDVVVLESKAPGGQAGSSSRIENYLGFPTGISGQALAGRALTQAQKFGSEVVIGRSVVRLDCDRLPYRVHLEGGGVVRTRTIVIASGVSYRKLEVPNVATFEGTGILYSATHLEGQLCVGEEVAVVGGGNSAGQAAVFLAGIAERVHMLVRGPGLAESMSRYLIQRIEGTPNVELLTQTRIEALEGAAGLERVTWRRLESDRRDVRAIRHLFVMTGADPHTAWLESTVILDAKKFVKTGGDLLPDDLARARWPLQRPPYLLETSVPGVFCVGDARSSSVKRVASAVGEGSICVQLVHRALQDA